jgi:hypothetical protein
MFKDAKEYDWILSSLEKTGKIAVDKKPILKQAWVYAVV